MCLSKIDNRRKPATFGYVVMLAEGSKLRTRYPYNDRRKFTVSGRWTSSKPHTHKALVWNNKTGEGFSYEIGFHVWHELEDALDYADWSAHYHKNVVVVRVAIRNIICTGWNNVVGPGSPARCTVARERKLLGVVA